MTTPDGDEVITSVAHLIGPADYDAAMIHESLEVAKFIDGLHMIRE